MTPTSAIYHTITTFANNTPKLEGNELKTWAWIQESAARYHSVSPALSRAKLADYLNVTNQQARDLLERMVELGYILKKRTGDYANRKAALYWLCGGDGIPLWRSATEFACKNAAHVISVLKTRIFEIKHFMAKKMTRSYPTTHDTNPCDDYCVGGWHDNIAGPATKCPRGATAPPPTPPDEYAGIDECPF